MIRLSQEDSALLGSYLCELEQDLVSADSDIIQTVTLERNTVRDILERQSVIAEDLLVLQDLRDYLQEEIDEIEEEAEEDGIELIDLDADDLMLERYFVLLARAVLIGGYLATFGFSGKVGKA